MSAYVDSQICLMDAQDADPTAADGGGGWSVEGADEPEPLPRVSLKRTAIHHPDCAANWERCHDFHRFPASRSGLQPETGRYRAETLRALHTHAKDTR